MPERHTCSTKHAARRTNDVACRQHSDIFAISQIWKRAPESMKHGWKWKMLETRVWRQDEVQVRPFIDEGTQRLLLHRIFAERR